MSATRLLVLAFVRAHGRAHGYMIGQDLLAWKADQWANTKTGSIYHALRQLTREGLFDAIEVEASEEGAARTDYALTPDGEEEFQRLMEVALTRPDPRPDMFCSGLIMMSALPRQTVLVYLSRRLAVLSDYRTNVVSATGNARWAGEKALPPHVEALLSYWMHHSSCAYEWVSDLYARIEGGAYVFADETSDAFGVPGASVSRA
ncbi:PadR family transcriptional regulator [Pelagibacterium montanilacus]|uniref:PadR family transcriptional regulator n=1 Tax=Pelagibacterium montanilacus TaxID=2185280 RepID=UPI000F8CD582|nr:PadR family transcriptional regulator [Pelagibacterium montanilacus]